MARMSGKQMGASLRVGRGSSVGGKSGGAKVRGSAGLGRRSGVGSIASNKAGKGAAARPVTLSGDAGINLLAK